MPNIILASFLREKQRGTTKVLAPSRWRSFLIYFALTSAHVRAIAIGPWFRICNTDYVTRIYT